MAHWRIELLGGLRIVGKQETHTHFESRKTAALLAHLALHPERSHPREELAALIWPDVPFETSRNRLKQSLSSLRKLLEGEGAVFTADHFSLGLLPGVVETDVAQWERLVRSGQHRAAAALWKGELLPGFYDDGIVTERERLNALQERLGAASAPSPHRLVRLPSPPTRFIGSEPEREALQQLLQQTRWVTVTGPGGIGKTRLAIEVARRCEAGDVVFVALAALHSVEQVLPAIAAALEFPLPPTPSPLDALCGFLHDCPTLLVLDNAEHLDAPALATLCQTLLRRLPHLRVLLTSRQLLTHPDEARFPLEPLCHSDDACALFLDRARRARGDAPGDRALCGLGGCPLGASDAGATGAGRAPSSPHPAWCQRRGAPPQCRGGLPLQCRAAHARAPAAPCRPHGLSWGLDPRGGRGGLPDSGDTGGPPRAL